MASEKMTHSLDAGTAPIDHGGYPPSYDQSTYPNLSPPQQPGFNVPGQPTPQPGYNVPGQPIPQPGYNVPGQPITAVLQAPPPPLGPLPTNYTCFSCHSNIFTEVRYVPGTKTHILAALLCFLGCFLCSCIPYCVDSCQMAQHYCPNCKAFLGVYSG